MRGCARPQGQDQTLTGELHAPPGMKLGFQMHVDPPGCQLHDLLKTCSPPTAPKKIAHYRFLTRLMLKAVCMRKMDAVSQCCAA